MAARRKFENTTLKLVLASASERRLTLLHQIGIVPALVDPTGIDERLSLPGETPTQMAAHLARRKAELAFALHPDSLVLGADTLVACGRRVLMKPEDSHDAQAFLSLLSGRRHRVHTGLCLIGSGKMRQRFVTTVVRFKRLTDREIQSYIDSNEWRGKAGAYAIQGRAGAFVKAINGSYSNVVGLPLYETYVLLTSFGYCLPTVDLEKSKLTV